MIDIPAEVVSKFWEDQRKKAEELQQFFESPKCLAMIQQVIASGHELDVEDMSYNMNGVRKVFDWGRDVTDQEIKLLCEALIDTSFAVDSFAEQIDPDNPFAHSYHLKGGLLVFSMHGQGSLYIIMPPQSRPDIVKQLDNERVEPAAMTEKQRIEALKPHLTPEFLNVLAEAARTVGWNCDHIATADFVETVFQYAGVKCPDIDPHDDE